MSPFDTVEADCYAAHYPEILKVLFSCRSAEDEGDEVRDD